MSRDRAVPALLALVALPACGHRGDPLPPLRRTPPALAEFRFAQRGDALEVSCRAPRASVDGVAFGDLRVEVLWAEGRADLEKSGRRREVNITPGASVRETLPLPAPGTLVRAAARAVSGGSPGPRSLILALEVQPPLEAPRDLAARLVAEGVSLEWQGRVPTPVAPPDLVPVTGSGPAARRVPGDRRSEDTSGAGAAEAPPVQPPAPDESKETPPAGEAAVEAPSAPQGTGEAPEEPIAPQAPAPPEGTAEGQEKPPGPAGGVEDKALPHGFYVYRRVAPQPYGPPLFEEPREERAFTDPRPPLGSTACYAVRAVASVQPLIESEESNEACVPVRDVEPPAPPAGVAVIPREGGLEVLWSPSPEPDLAAYRVYRRSGEQEPQLQVELPVGTTAWLDAGAAPDTLHSYTVTAVDGAGNESAPSGAAEGRRR